MTPYEQIHREVSESLSEPVKPQAPSQRIAITCKCREPKGFRFTYDDRTHKTFCQHCYGQVTR